MTGYDITKLNNLKRNSDGSIQCACPACQSQNRDKTGEHLRIYSNGAFSCVIDKSRAHNKTIFTLLRDPNADPIEFIEPFRPTVEKIYPEDTLTKLLPVYDYWVGRGAHEDVLKAVGGGMATNEEKGKLSGRFVFPCRNGEGRIIGFAGRLVEESSFAPKWKILGKKNNFVFPPLTLSRRAIESKSQIILVESIGCVLALAGQGIWNTMCLFGLNISGKQLGLLIGMAVKHIVIATNNEESGIGNEAAQKLKKRLGSFFNEENITIRLPFKKDFMEMTEDDIVKWNNLE